MKKEHCIGHVQKRMGKNLRDWRKNAAKDKSGLVDGGRPGGVGRLTDAVIDK